MTAKFRSSRLGHWWLDRCFLYVGRIAESKGIDCILRAWLSLAEDWGDYCPPIWLVGGLPKEIETARSKLGTETINKYEQTGHIRWWGYLDAPGISTLLLKAYVLITQSLYEPGGRVVLEALSQGIPVIATPHGLADELVVDWHTGFIVDHGDIAVLRRRMEHFALQPLLRHAMGREAHRVAAAALHEWDFLGIHIKIYRQAINGQLAEASTAGNKPLVANAPIPKMLGGVYPFEGQSAGPSEISSFVARECGTPSREPYQLPVSNGRSRIWITEVHGRRFVIKHAPTTYRRRPIWDRGFRGSLVEKQEGRLANELLAAQCHGVAPVLASCERTGLLLRRWLEPVTIDGSNMEASATLLLSFHKSVPAHTDLRTLEANLDQEWRQMEDDNFVDELCQLQASWRSRGYWWHPWQPVSLRLGWRWFDLGLRRKWLLLPIEVENELLASLPREIAVADKEAFESSFGVCHGDCEPDCFRLDERDALVLIDCERFHPGYFGSDWSTLILSLLDGFSGRDEMVEFIRKAAELVESAISASLLMSWLRWQIAMDLCRAHGLLKAQAVETGIVRWRQLESVFL